MSSFAYGNSKLAGLHEDTTNLLRRVHGCELRRPLRCEDEVRLDRQPRLTSCLNGVTIPHIISCRCLVDLRIPRVYEMM
jgi:hypothetical protein